MATAKARQFKRGDVVEVKMNRGPNRHGQFVKAHITGANGTWYEIKHAGSKETFRCRPACVAFA